jgi:hypothetical protein
MDKDQARNYYVGKRGVLNFGSLAFEVEVMEIEFYSVGNFRLIVRPISGSGRKIIDVDDITFID